MKLLNLVPTLLLLQSGLHAGILTLTGSGTFPGGTPSTPYTEAGETFEFQYLILDQPVVLGDFSPNAIAVGVSDWTYRLNGIVIASGDPGVVFLYANTDGGLFDLCTDLTCAFTIGMTGDALITSLSTPVLVPGTYAGNYFTYYDGANYNRYPSDSTVTLATPEPSTWFSLGTALAILALVSGFRYRRPAVAAAASAA